MCHLKVQKICTVFGLMANMFRISDLDGCFLCPATSLHEASAIMITAPTIVSMTKNMHILRNASVFQDHCTGLGKKNNIKLALTHSETAKTSCSGWCSTAMVAQRNV